MPNPPSPPAPRPWPATMPLLDESEVQHGVYRNDCGTTHCAVGHVAVAFGLDPHPSNSSYGWEPGPWGSSKDTVAPVGSPMHRFARRFAIELGADEKAFDERYAEEGLRALEDVFEWGDLRKKKHGGKDPTEAETAKAFNRAVRKSGYTRTINRPER